MVQDERPSQEEEIVAAASSAIKQNGKAVLMTAELRSILRDLLPSGVSYRSIERSLHEAGVIQNKTLRSEGYRDVSRIAVPALNPTPYDYAVSIRSGSYLCHASALHLLGLTQQQPKTIYVNKEQSPKPEPFGEMTQEAIDRAFSRPQRRSKYSFRVDSAQIVMLSGKASGQAGVITEPTSGLPVTGLERTLIDITVRPRYAGGVFQVAQAFENAVDDIDVDRLVSLLEVLNYRYPYHQAIGFYLERAGASETKLGNLRAKGIDFDFYLDYSMASFNYDESWRVFYPLGI